MDGPAARVAWSKEAFSDLQTLPKKIRDLIRHRVPLMQQNRHLYQVEANGEFEGLQRMVVGWCKVYYTYWHSEHTLYIEAIVPSINEQRSSPR